MHGGSGVSDDFFSGRGGADPLRRTRFDRSAVIQGLRPGPGRPRQADGGPPPDRGLPVALVQLAGLRRVRRRDLRPAVARPAARPDGRGAGEARRGLRVPRPSSASRSSASTIATSPRRARPSPRRRPTSTRWSTRPRAHMARTGPEAPVGHGQPVQPSALRGRRGDQPGPRGVRLRRGAGQARCSRRPSASAARTTSCGAAARATRRCSTPTSPARRPSSPGS